jgi:hypothetical protein
MAMMQAVNESAVRAHRITGGGGVQLHVEETGNPSGRPVLFIHGLSQSHLAWNRQMHSDLTRDLRMVAIDLRGHGESERPVGAYGDSALWADDVHAVITSLDLERPIHRQSYGPSSATTSASAAKVTPAVSSCGRGVPSGRTPSAFWDCGPATFPALLHRRREEASRSPRRSSGSSPSTS